MELFVIMSLKERNILISPGCHSAQVFVLELRLLIFHHISTYKTCFFFCLFVFQLPLDTTEEQWATTCLRSLSGMWQLGLVLKLFKNSVSLIVKCSGQPAEGMKLETLFCLGEIQTGSFCCRGGHSEKAACKLKLGTARHSLVRKHSCRTIIHGLINISWCCYGVD